HPDRDGGHDGWKLVRMRQLSERHRAEIDLRTTGRPDRGVLTLLIVDEHDGAVLRCQEVIGFRVADRLGTGLRAGRSGRHVWPHWVQVRSGSVSVSVSVWCVRREVVLRVRSTKSGSNPGVAWTASHRR